MGDSNTASQSTGSKEKISKWKLYKTQIKRLKESSKPEVLTSAKGGVIAELLTNDFAPDTGRWEPGGGFAGLRVWHWYHAQHGGWAEPARQRVRTKMRDIIFQRIPSSFPELKPVAGRTFTTLLLLLPRRKPLSGRPWGTPCTSSGESWDAADYFGLHISKTFEIFWPNC